MKFNKVLVLAISIILLFTPYLLSVSAFSASFPDISKALNLTVFFIVPGCFLAVAVGQTTGLRWDEVLALDIVISMAMVSLVSIYLSFAVTQFTDTAMSLGLCLVVLPSGLFLLLRNPKEKIAQKNTSLRNIIKTLIKTTIDLSLSFLFGFVLTMSVIPETYWRGWDPWINTPIASTILDKGFNPLEPKGYPGLQISGFYYFIAATRAFTGIDLYTITRFAGPFLAGLASMLVFLLVRRLEGWGPGLLASALLGLNSWFVYRFSMALRENVAYIFFLCVIFLLIVQYQQGSRKLYPLVTLGVLLGVILTFHPFVTLVGYGVIIVEMILRPKIRRSTSDLFFFFLMPPLLSFPYLEGLFDSFVEITESWLPASPVLIFALLVSAGVIVLLFWKTIVIRKLSQTKNILRTGVLILVLVLVLGAFYSVLFPKNFAVLGSWDPGLTMNMFAMSSLILALLGFITILWIPASPVLMAFALVVLLFLNFPNVNIAFPLERLAIYICLLLSYGAARALNIVYKLVQRLHLKFRKTEIVLATRGREFSHSVGRKEMVVILCLGLLILTDLRIFEASTEGWGQSNFTQKDVESAINFLDFLKDDDIIVPQAWSIKLLYYVGLNSSRIIHNQSLLQEIYSTTQYQSFCQIILSRYPNASRAQVFTLRRWIGGENFPAPSIDFLEGFGEKHELGSVNFYTISLHERYFEKELLEHPIELQLPDGVTQLVEINVTGTDMNQKSVMVIGISNYETAKPFFVRFYDIHGNSTEKIWEYMETGDRVYYINFRGEWDYLETFHDLSTKVDIHNLSTLEMGFSWWSSAKVDLKIASLIVMLAE